MRVLSPRPDSAERADIHDPAAALPFHDAGGLLAAEERGLEVDGVDEVPVGFGDIERVEAGEAGGVVDEAIEAAQTLFDVGEHALDLRDVLQVGPEKLGAATFLGSSFGFGFGAVVVDDDAGAFASEAKGDAAADALGRPGHKNDAAREVRPLVRHAPPPLPARSPHAPAPATYL